MKAYPTLFALAVFLLSLSALKLLIAQQIRWTPVINGGGQKIDKYVDVFLC